MKVRKMLAGVVTVAIVGGVVELSNPFGAMKTAGGSTVLASDETVTVGLVEHSLKGKVTKVEVDKNGDTLITVSVGRAGGVNENTRFTGTENGKAWLGTVVSLTDNSVVLKRDKRHAQRHPKIAVDPRVGQETSCYVTTKLTGKPGIAVNGLQITLTLDSSEPRAQSAYKLPNTLPRTARFSEGKELIVQYKNVSDKPLILGFIADREDREYSPKVFAKDAAGRVLPRAAETEIPEFFKMADQGQMVTILKPGQVLTENRPEWASKTEGATGKLTVWVEFEYPQSEPVTGIAVWSGKITSNAIEYDMQ